jgi:GTP-binding protein EngB required for normal cell division
MDIGIYSSIAEWLGKTNDLLKLSKIEEIASEGKYYVTMWGHYSAGKSRLINSLLGRNLLPVRSRETTVVLTYIQYGSNEECRIIYDNGMISTAAVEETRSIYQKMESDTEMRRIDHIEVYVDCDILRNGLVLVDTPGVNTVIQNHQELAAEAIEESGKIVYVLGNSPSDVDRRFIKEIEKCGIDILFVRTKCDRINEKEESVEDALDGEKKEIERFLNKECVFIPVSNEKESKWNDNICVIRDRIGKIADSMAEELEKSITGRLKFYAKSYKEELEEVCNQITATLTGNTEKLSDEIAKCDAEIKRLEELSGQLENKIEEKTNQTKISATRDIENFVEKSVDEFIKTIDSIQFSETFSSEIEYKYNLSFKNAVREMQLIMQEYFDEIIADEDKIIAGTKDMEYISSAIPPTYVEVQAENTRILDMYQTKLFEVKNELSKIIEERQIVNTEVSNMRNEYDDSIYEGALAELNKELNEIPSGMALKLADEQNIQPSSVFKKIGQTVDIALLLLPGDVIVKGVKAAANTTKIAQAIHKMGKAGQVILKTGEVAAQNAKAVDHVRDVAYTLNNVLGKRRYSTAKEKEQAALLVDKAAQGMGYAFENYKVEKQSGNVFDALSVAYWTEKLGAQFDKPPKMEVDMIEDENRNRLRRDIESEKKRLSEERMLKKKKLGLVETKEKELKMLEQEQRAVMDQIESEIKKHEADIMKKSRVQACNQYKQKYSSYLAENLQIASKRIIDEYYTSVNQNIVLYSASRNSELMNAIQEKKTMLEELVDAKEHGNDELQKKYELGKKYLDSIKELV